MSLTVVFLANTPLTLWSEPWCVHKCTWLTLLLSSNTAVESIMGQKNLLSSFPDCFRNHPNSQTAINTFPWKCLHLWLYSQQLLFHCNEAKNLPKAVNTFNFIYLQRKRCNWNCSIKSTASLILESIWQYYHYYAQFMVWRWVLQNSFLKPELFFLVVSNSFIPLLKLWLEKFQVIVLE